MIGGVERIANEKLAGFADTLSRFISSGDTGTRISVRTLADIDKLRGTTVFLRLDLNAPVENGAIIDDYRLKKAMLSVDALRAAGARIVIGSHIETANPDSGNRGVRSDEVGFEENYSTLKPIYDYLKVHISGCVFIRDFFPEDVSSQVRGLPEGGVAFLENLRRYSGEKENDEVFARHLASFADIYVNDAFATAHRKHASIVGVPKFIPGFVGPLIEGEINNLSKAFTPPRPFVFVLGGAKFVTKLPLVRKFLSLADSVFVGGALGNDILKARGLEVGLSLVSKDFDASDLLGSEKLITPVDVIVENETGREVKPADKVIVGDSIVDAGPETVELLRKKISGAKFVLWNGPLGVFEKGHREATDSLARIIAESGAQSVVGGGDTLASISSLGLDEKFSFISTGGGAMLDFLANGTLPGLEVLKR